MAKGLAGVIDEDNERLSKEEDAAPEPATETSFKEKEPDTNPDPISDQMKQRIALIQKMEKAFNQEEVNTVMKIINALSAKKESLALVADLLNIKI